MRRLVRCPCVTGATLRTHLVTENQTVGIGHRGMGLGTRLLVSSSAGLTLGVYMLTVDNVARSSMVAAILCPTICKIALLRRLALATAYITKCPLAFVQRCQYSVPYKPWLSFHLQRPSNVD